MAIIARAQITLSAVVDIQAVYKYYKLQSSTSAKPSKPTSINTLPPSGWTDAEPAYEPGSMNTLYTVELTVFTDGSFSYSDVMTDSSYEAAKAAYNKAVDASEASTDAQITASGAMDRINSNEKATDNLVSRLADIERTLDAITLRVATIANNKAFRAGEDISSYVTETAPTLMNYPTFTDFFIWKACATNIYCSDALICGTNNYAAHENAVAHCTADDTYYIFEKDNAGEYGWRAMTHDEYMEKSNKYSLINIEDDQIIISSALNNALTNLLINSTGVSVTAGKLFCC